MKQETPPDVNLIDLSENIFYELENFTARIRRYLMSKETSGKKYDHFIIHRKFVSNCEDI